MKKILLIVSVLFQRLNFLIKIGNIWLVDMQTSAIYSLVIVYQNVSNLFLTMRDRQKQNFMGKQIPIYLTMQVKLIKFWEIKE